MISHNFDDAAMAGSLICHEQTIFSHEYFLELWWKGVKEQTLPFTFSILYVPYTGLIKASLTERLSSRVFPLGGKHKAFTIQQYFVLFPIWVWNAWRS